MHTGGLTRVAPILAVLDRLGAPVDRLLARAGVPMRARANPDMLIPTWSAVRLLGEGARSQGIESLGLLAGREACLETLGTFGRVIPRSSTVGAALEAVVTDQPTFSSIGRVWLRDRGEQVDFCHAFTNNNFDKFDNGWQQLDHYGVMLMIGLVRLGAGATWRPVVVDLQTAESSALRHAQPLLGTRLAFGQPSTKITLSRALLDQRLPRPDLDVAIPRESIVARRALAPPRDFVSSVARAVETLSWEGYPNIHRTAEFLGVSVRTMQRHLAEAGITHESLVGRARFETAAALLAETDTKVLDVALDLGYSDHAHFTRAFRRWAGYSPQAYRRIIREKERRAS